MTSITTWGCRARKYPFDVGALPTERFRRQHQELLVLSGEIRGRLDPAKLMRDPGDVRRLFAKLKGLLAVHARMENEALYPRLMTHDDAYVREKVTSIFQEVGPVHDAVEAHGRHWPDAEAIQSDVAGFIRDTTTVMRALDARVTREDAELYPLADSLG